MGVIDDLLEQADLAIDAARAAITVRPGASLLVRPPVPALALLMRTQHMSPRMLARRVKSVVATITSLRRLLWSGFCDPSDNAGDAVRPRRRSPLPVGPACTAGGTGRRRRRTLACRNHRCSWVGLVQMHHDSPSDMTRWAAID